VKNPEDAPPSTVGRWIEAAEERGYLPATTQVANRASPSALATPKAGALVLRHRPGGRCPYIRNRSAEVALLGATAL
jgi:hypothetical protein